MKKILVLNGPNLNMLGTRETEIYGISTLKDVENMIKERALSLNIEVDFYQSNHEGDIVDKICFAKDNFDGIIINPAAYTHTSIAIRDAISAVELPVVEVHLSNICSREDFRHTSITAPVCKAQISGCGKYGYLFALEFLQKTM